MCNSSENIISIYANYYFEVSECVLIVIAYIRDVSGFIVTSLTISPSYRAVTSKDVIKSFNDMMKIVIILGWSSSTPLGCLVCIWPDHPPIATVNYLFNSIISILELKIPRQQYFVTESNILQAMFVFFRSKAHKVFWCNSGFIKDGILSFRFQFRFFLERK